MAQYDFGRLTPDPLTPTKGQLLRQLWNAYAATPGARCPDCGQRGLPLGRGVGHAGFCRLATLLSGEP